MKHARKLASLLLALVMVLSLATTAFAEGTNTITVKNAVKDQTYKLYKMLDLIVNDAHTAYSYTVNSAWTNFFKAAEGENLAGKGLTYVNIDAQGYVTWKDSADVAAFAKDAEEFAKNLSVLQTYKPTADGDFIFNNLEAGYYLVTSTLGTKATVGTTPSDPNPAIQEKNQAPTNVKTVEEDSKVGVAGQEPWGTTNDADIGQTVNFKSTITAQPGAENYIFHDDMSVGLTLDSNSIKVYTVNDGTETELDTKNYEVKTTDTCKTDCDFEVHFKQDYLNTITASTTIVVKYSAVLNENAVVGSVGNPNKSYLDYGTNASDETKPGSSTPPSETKTYTWDFNIFKYTKNAQNQEVPLSGAKFTLSKNANGSEPISLIATTEVGNSEHEDGDLELSVLSDTTTTYRVAKEGETGVTEFEVGSDGKVIIQGLDADTYYLTETAAPAGYNKLVAPIKVTIDHEGNVKYATKTTADGLYGDEVSADATQGIKVLNQTGTELPSTGGMGTTIFYVLGSILVIGAAVLLVTKKRMNAVDR